MAEKVLNFAKKLTGKKLEKSSKKDEKKRELNLLLIGKTGHGKSSTGNSIVGRKHFVAMGGGSAVTKEFQCGYTQRDDFIIKVVDVPGVMDTDEKTREGQNNLVIDAIKNGFKHFPEGFDALLLVMSFTNRITEEEKEAIKALKCILGEDMLKKHTICVFSHGDSFYDNFGEDKDFKEWGASQTEYKDLFHECEWRFVVFDNLTKDKKRKKSQQENLISEILNLKSRYDNYTSDEFADAGKVREDIKKKALILEEYSRRVGLIQDSIHKVMSSTDKDKLERIREVKSNAAQVLEDVCKEDEINDPNLKETLNLIIFCLDSCEKFTKPLKESERKKEEQHRKELDNAIREFQSYNSKQRPTEVITFPIHRIVPGVVEGFTNLCGWFGSKFK